MKIQSLHQNFRLPLQASPSAGAYDLYMPEAGKVWPHAPAGVLVGLGFAAALPPGHIALILPRSGVGAKKGIELNNTVGLIDDDYRGEWMVSVRTKNDQPVTWEAGDRLFQFTVIRKEVMTFEQVASLDDTTRGAGGFGSSGN